MMSSHLGHHARTLGDVEIWAWRSLQESRMRRQKTSPWTIPLATVLTIALYIGLVHAMGPA